MILGPDGYLYVASATSSRVLRFDADTGDFVDVFVSTGSGGLMQPEGIAFGPDSTGDGVQELFVSSRGSDQVLRYNGDTGAFIDVFAELGIINPTGLVFGADRTGDSIPELYVAGFASDNVVEFNGSTGAFVRQLVPPGRGNLDGPVGLSFEPDGRLYVVSSNNNRIIRYDSATGAFINTFVAAGSGGLVSRSISPLGPTPTPMATANSMCPASATTAFCGTTAHRRFPGQLRVFGQRGLERSDRADVHPERSTDCRQFADRCRHAVRHGRNTDI